MKTSVVSSAWLLLTFGGIAAAQTAKTVSLPVPVTVQNTAANPVPITGSVVVSNQTSQPTAVPFQAAGICNLGTGSYVTTCNVYVVPVGKRAVVEYVSLAVNSNVGSVIEGAEYRPTLDTTLGGSTIHHQLQPYKVGGSIDPGSGQLVRLNADPGSTVVGRIATNYNYAAALVFSISGTLVDAP